jgi:hypothetical protein
MYFKLLKVVIGFFILCTLMELPLMNIYSNGKNGGDSSLNFVSLGNLAFNYYQCTKKDIKKAEEMFIGCASGSSITSL